MTGWQLLLLGYFLGTPLGFLLCSVLVASKDPPKPHTTCKDCVHRHKKECPFSHIECDVTGDSIFGILTNKMTSIAKTPKHMNRKSCEGCIYHRALATHGYGFVKYCNYLLDTGKPRGCPPEKCDKKTVRRLKN